MRQWRVGTLSMGILLIVVGVLLIAGRINGVSSVLLILKWWPLVLILLGIEILAYAYFSRQEGPRIKYDGLSIFIVIIIITFSMGAYVISSIPWNNSRGVFIGNFTGQSKYDSVFTKSVNIDPKGKTKLSVKNSFGNIDIQKINGRNIKVDAEITIRNNDEAYAKSIKDKIIEIRQSGEIEIATRNDQYTSDRNLVQSIGVNYKIGIPEGLEVSVEDEFGNVYVDGVSKSLTIVDKNGHVTSKNIGLNLNVQNSFGDIDIDGVKGSCDIKDRNGEVNVKNIDKDLNIDNEFGNISMEAIKGSIGLSNRNADITGRNIDGNLKIESQFCRIDVEDIKGSLDVRGKNGGMEFNNVSGDMKVKNEFGDVKITNAFKAIDINNRNGSIELQSDRIYEKDIRMENEFGGIDIALPKSQNCIIKAYDTYGSINNNYDLEAQQQGSNRSLNGKLGAGGIRIDLKNKNGDIDIK